MIRGGRVVSVLHGLKVWVWFYLTSGPFSTCLRKKLQTVQLFFSFFKQHDFIRTECLVSTEDLLSSNRLIFLEVSFILSWSEFWWMILSWHVCCVDIIFLFPSSWIYRSCVGCSGLWGYFLLPYFGLYFSKSLCLTCKKRSLVFMLLTLLRIIWQIIALRWSWFNKFSFFWR